MTLICIPNGRSATFVKHGVTLICSPNGRSETEIQNDTMQDLAVAASRRASASTANEDSEGSLTWGNHRRSPCPAAQDVLQHREGEGMPPRRSSGAITVSGGGHAPHMLEQPGWDDALISPDQGRQAGRAASPHGNSSGVAHDFFELHDASNHDPNGSGSGSTNLDGLGSSSTNINGPGSSSTDVRAEVRLPPCSEWQKSRKSLHQTQNSVSGNDASECQRGRCGDAGDAVLVSDVWDRLGAGTSLREVRAAGSVCPQELRGVVAEHSVNADCVADVALPARESRNKLSASHLDVWRQADGPGAAQSARRRRRSSFGTAFGLYHDSEEKMSSPIMSVASEVAGIECAGEAGLDLSESFESVDVMVRLFACFVM